MKALFRLILLILAFSVSATAFCENAEEGEVIHDTTMKTICPRVFELSDFRLLPTKEGLYAGEYSAYCRICDEQFIVYAGTPDDSAPGDADPAECGHHFRCADIPREEAWLPMRTTSTHALFLIYDFTCDLCGEQAEGHLRVSGTYPHQCELFTETHIDTYEHLLVYHCNVCDAYPASIVNCFPDTDIGLGEGVCLYELQKHQQQVEETIIVY